MIHHEEESLRQWCIRVAASAGLSVENASVAYGQDNDVGAVYVRFTDETLTFDALSRLSELFGTRQIDVSCDLGCASDRTHDKMIAIRNPTAELRPPKTNEVK